MPDNAALDPQRDPEPIANITAQLRQHGDFLALSRQTPEVFAAPLQFRLGNNTLVDIVAPGVIQFSPDNAGNKDLIYSCGIHGNETAPIEICDELAQALLTEQQCCAHRLLLIFGNLPAMDIGERFVEENMNRLFSGAHSQEGIPSNPERERAALLERLVAQFYLTAPKSEASTGETPARERFHYDLHTAIRDSKNEKFAVYPYVPEVPYNKAQISFLGQCGVNTILLSNAPTTTFSFYSAKQFHASGFTVELGKVRPFGENDMSRFAAAKQQLFALATQRDIEIPAFEPRNFLIYRVNQVINRQQEDFRLNFSDNAPNFSDYAAGTLLAEETGCQYHAQHDGEAIVFPNAKVALGQRALLTVVPTEI